MSEFRPVGASGLDIRTDQLGAWTRVTLAGELDMDNARDLATCVHELVVNGRVRLEVNLGRLTFCDSCGLAALLGAAETCRLAGGELTVTEPAGAVRRVMAITGVDTLLCGTPAGRQPEFPEAPAAIA